MISRYKPEFEKAFVKTASLCIALLFCITLITGCGTKDDSISDTQQVNFTVADGDESVITYSEDHIQSVSVSLYVTNHSEFPLTLLMVRQDKGKNANDLNEELTVSLDAKETKLIESIDKSVPYEVGCRTNAKEGTEIEVTFKEYDE